ncbi:TraM recognition domain-containing protein, partial [Candidatus Peregrinibacteria bacterium]|nr:TraM recognition domain-containing protein [Candidatus Peregrinibacteria bacterium]
KEDRRDFFVYIDEFQNYVTDSIEVILSEARKYRLGLIMAHQYLAQLEGGGNDYKSSKKASVKDAVFGNVGSIMAYKIGAQDAEYMAKEMAPIFSDQDLINIDKYKAVMKLSIDGQPSQPFSITPVNPYTEIGDKEAAAAYKQLSRLKYGRDKEFVEREILKRIGADAF